MCRWTAFVKGRCFAYFEGSGTIGRETLVRTDS